MPSARSIAVAILLALGVLLAAGNLWFTAARSTIPIALEGRVVSKRRLIEKIPGVDDVYLLELHSGTCAQVDKHVFDAVAVGDHISKRRWSAQLDHEGRLLSLRWSADFRGMVCGMPIVAVTLVLLAAAARREGRRA